MRNLNSQTVASFGDEWRRYQQSSLSEDEHQRMFDAYFDVFPWDELPDRPVGFDMGCGSGRWAKKVAPRVGHLNCIDPSAEALAVAKRNLANQSNVSFLESGVSDNPLDGESQDFGYSLGVLHHVPNTAAALHDCVRFLKPGAPFLVYLYYSFDNRPSWYRLIWRMSEAGRAVVSRCPPTLKSAVTDTVAAAVYWPLARLALVGEKFGCGVSNWPLSSYRALSFYTMRTDARDRFGTPLEQRFSRDEVSAMMVAAGLERDPFFRERAVLVRGRIQESVTRLRIAKLTKYGTLAASTRQRFEQYDPFLADADCTSETYPLLDNSYLRGRYDGRKSSPAYLATRYMQRLYRLVRGNFDLLWVHCELFPYLPGMAERFVAFAGAPVVFDYDDAIFHNYDQHRSATIRKLLGGKLAPLLRRADAAFCGNSYLQDYASRYCDNTYIVPTVLDTQRYRPATSRPLPDQANPAATIGWLGTPSTWNSYVLPMLPVLIEEAVESGAEISAIGGDQTGTGHPLLRRDEWSEAEEVAQLQSMDIGIMPLNEDPWARGKCGYKLIQYMACGLPVIASPVGVNADIVEHGVNGFLATNEEQWRTAIRTLLANPDLRHRMGAAGRKKVEQHYSIQVHGPKVASLLHQLALANRK